jgi:hypothetical protein
MLREYQERSIKPIAEIKSCAPEVRGETSGALAPSPKSHIHQM